MEDKVLLFESRDLCYESNRYFAECLKEAFEDMGYSAEICDLSEGMEEKLDHVLKRQDQYRLAIDFNSLLPSLELDDGTPYLEAFHAPFYNYMVDHPLYHHAALKRPLSNHAVICIDQYHQIYARHYYPHIKSVLHLPLGAMRADMERSFGQKRLELLFLGTYDSDQKLYGELSAYPSLKRKEVSALIEMMEADPDLTQEEALNRYLGERGERLAGEEFARRLTHDYLADLYLRNLNRKRTVLAAARAKVPFTVIGHGWEQVKGLDQKHVSLRQGISFAVSVQMMADAKMLLNSTPGFHGGLHDRVYSAMANRALCFTEGSRYAKQKLIDGKTAVFYDVRCLDALAEKIAWMRGHPARAGEIAERACEHARREETWQKRAENLASQMGWPKLKTSAPCRKRKSLV